MCMFDVFSVDFGFREAKFILISVVQFTNFSNYLFLIKCILSKCKHLLTCSQNSMPLLQLHMGVNSGVMVLYNSREIYSSIGECAQNMEQGGALG